MTDTSSRNRTGCIGAAVIVAFILAVNVISWFAGPSAQVESPQAGSSLSNGRSGLRGLAIFYERLGAESRQRRFDFKDMSDVDPQQTSLFVVGAWEEIGDREIESLRRWVEAGGFLVAGEPAGQLRGEFAPAADLPSTALADDDMRPTDSEDGDPPPRPRTDSLPVALAPLLRDVKAVSAYDRSYYDESGEALPLTQGRRGPTSMVVQAGRGQVLFMASGILTNDGLDQADNAQFALNLLTPDGIARRTAVFDEYHHGFRQAGGSIMAMPAQWRLALAEILLAVALFAWTRAPRRSQPAADPPVLPRARGEFIDAVAGSMQAAKGSDAACRILQDDLRARLRRRLFVRGRSFDQELAAGAAGLGIDPAKVGHALAPIEGADDQALLARARILNSLRREL